MAKGAYFYLPKPGVYGVLFSHIFMTYWFDLLLDGVFCRHNYKYCTDLTGEWTSEKW